MQQLLSPTQLAELLGIAKQTVYNRLNIGASLPPYVRIGRLIRFPNQGIEAWLSAQAEAVIPNVIQLETPTRRRGRPSKAEQISRRNQAQR